MTEASNTPFISLTFKSLSCETFTAAHNFNYVQCIFTACSCIYRTTTLLLLPLWRHNTRPML